MSLADILHVAVGHKQSFQVGVLSQKINPSVLNAIALKANPEKGLALTIEQVTVAIISEVDPVFEVIGY